MSATRAGFFTGLLLLTGFNPMAHNAHQGKYYHWPLFADFGHATPSLGRLPSKGIPMAQGRHASSTVGRPVVRITHGALVRWTRVAICEEGGWNNVHGPKYWGAIGWLQSTWDMFRASWMPARMDQATVTEQVWAAQRFAGYYHLVPDQHGCTGGY